MPLTANHGMDKNKIVSGQRANVKLIKANPPPGFQ